MFINNVVIINTYYILKLHSFRIASKTLCDANHIESSFRHFFTTFAVYAIDAKFLCLYNILSPHRGQHKQRKRAMWAKPRAEGREPHILLLGNPSRRRERSGALAYIYNSLN